MPPGQFKNSARTPERGMAHAVWLLACAAAGTSSVAMASMGIDVDLELSVSTFGSASQHHMATYEIAMRFSPQNVMRGGRDSFGMLAGNRVDRGDVRWSQDGR